eukprot:CAMPEP_0202692936 /NCGR_PEP_ID=MMETSP1385-20130828/7189_1 /ASSEMBLY_ACC=CAM_ASM_000861 /TAXON_ID=933848 /ORGANISM="Elphidium margaritaceum" /LENGTH=1069 /DNA_ID=CAMNT_0049348545 /DNA_START=13 /DNA_END=3222 /DNA_ORIENTATION=+
MSLHTVHKRPKDDTPDPVDAKQDDDISFDKDAIDLELNFSVEAMIAKNDQGTAVKILKDMLKTDSNNAGLHYRIGVIAKRHWKNFEQARDEFLAALECDDGHVLSVWALADLYKNQFADYDQARKYFARVVELKPGWGIGWKEYADLLGWRLGDWEAAVRAYDESVKYEHHYRWNCYNNCAWGLANKMGDYAKAERYYRASLAINNNNITWANLGRLYMDFLHDDGEAENCFRESLKAKEATSGAHTFLGQVLAKRVDDVDAVEAAKKHLIRALELGDTRGKETLEAIIAREKAAIATTTASAADGDGDAKEQEEQAEKRQFFSRTERVLDVLPRPTEALMASPDNAVLACGDDSGRLVLYDLLTLKEGALSETASYELFALERTQCNEVQFSRGGGLLAAAFFDERQRSSRMVLFDIGEIVAHGLSAETVAKCGKPVSEPLQFQNRINTNAMQFTADDASVLVGLQMQLVVHIPLYQVKVADGKLGIDLYSNVLLKQCGLDIQNLESVSSLHVEGELLLVGTTRGRVFVIDVRTKKSLYVYNHKLSTSIVTSVFMTGDLRWIVSSDVYGEMHFYAVCLKSDVESKGANKGQGKQRLQSALTHGVLDSIERAAFFEDMHFRAVSELQSYNNKLVCSASHDGNLSLFELVSEDPYGGQAIVKEISRLESTHEYLAINTASWIMTKNLGLCLFTGGDDKRILVHGLTDVLLEALPESMAMAKHKHHKQVAFDIGDLDGSKSALARIAEEEKHKLNGWVNLWAFGSGDAKADDGTAATTQDMVNSALGTLQTMTEPVILNLCEDKLKYERVFARLLQDASDAEGLKQIEQLVADKIRTQACYDSNIKQANGDLIALLCDGSAANQQLHELAAELAVDPVISGMYEGPVSIKKMKRAVEKSLLKNYAEAASFSFDTSLDFAFLKDLARAGITCRDLKAIYNCLHKLLTVYGKQVEIVRMKNRFVPESELGYRDILLNLRFIEKVDDGSGNKVYKYNGHIVELQLHHEKFQNVRKKGKGHANYGATRFLMDFIKITTKKETAKPKQGDGAKTDDKNTPQHSIKENLAELWNVTV